MNLFGKKDICMTEGSVMRSLISYSVPLILAGMLQMLFNAADLAVVGHFAEKSATASVGATGSIIGLTVSSVIGISAGVNVILSRCIGASDPDKVKKTVQTAMTTASIIGIAVMIFGLSISRYSLVATDCPESALEGAVSYMKIYFLGAPAIFIYNFGFAIIRTRGDTKSPLAIMSVAGVANVLLNLLFVAVFHLDAAGVAMATSLSQYIGAILTTFVLVKDQGFCHFDIKSPHISSGELLGILRYGIPSGINTAVYSITNILIQTAINTYGESAVSGNSAASSIEGFLVVGVSSFSSACIAFMGQNIGAGKKDRVKRVFGDSLIFVMLYCAVLGWGSFLFMKQIVGAVYLPNDSLGVQNSIIRGTYLLTLYWMSGILNILSAGTSSLGFPTLGMINSLSTVLSVRLIWMKLIYPKRPSLAVVYQCYPMTWLVTILFFIVILVFAVKRYKKLGYVK